MYRDLNRTVGWRCRAVKGSKLASVLTPEEIETLRRDPDPISRGRRATDLLTRYQQQAAELARLRRAAIEEAYRDRGLSYTQIAAAMGITKGRITQIRGRGPAPERAFFGVGPVSVGIPQRHGVTDRTRPLIAAEDAQTADDIERLLSSYAFAVTRYQIEPDTADPPAGDTVVICGPKSAPLGAALLAEDQALTMAEQDGRWWIQRRDSGERYGSPADEQDPADADVAYVGHHQDADRAVVHIAGVHAIGSLGAVHYLTGHLARLFADAGEGSFSLVVRASYQGLRITGSKLVAGPFRW